MRLKRLFLELKRTLTPGGGVTERTMKSGVWAALVNVSTRGIQLGKVAVLARLLSPADFGLMGIALLTLAGLEHFSRLGLDSALIQRTEENVDDYLDTAWTMKLLRGVALAVVAFALAPVAAEFFGEPRAAPVIRVIAVATVLTGLKNPGVMYLTKNLEFHRQFVLSMSGTIANAVVTIALAVEYRNVWPLIAGYLVGNVVTLAVSYRVHGYRPWPRFDYAKARDLFGYGKWLTASAILLFFLNQGDDGFVGWFLGASALGFYQMAYRFSNAPATEVTQVITSVVFPAYSRIQEDEQRLREGFFRTLQLSSTVAFPTAAGMIVVAPSFVRAFLGEQWIPVVVPMQILALWGAVRSLDSNAGPLFKSIGRPDYLTKLQFVRLGLLAVCIYPATDRWGVAGTAAAIVATSLVTNPVVDVLAVRAVDGSLRRFASTLAYPTVGSLVMGLAVLGVGSTLDGQSALVEFLLSAGTGIIVYPLVMIGMDRRYDVGIEWMLGRIIGSFR